MNRQDYTNSNIIDNEKENNTMKSHKAEAHAIVHESLKK